MLTQTPAGSSTSVNGSRVSSPINDMVDDNPNKLTTYLHQLAGCYEMEVDVILKDHCYARPWNWKPENVYVKPIKKLFFSKKNSPIEKHMSQDDEINVESDTTEPVVPPVDMTRVRHLMDELQRLANFARPEENDDWEEQIDKMLWTPVQNRIFAKVVKILSAERLARLAKASSSMEPIFRRTSMDTAARRFRETLASAGWDWRLAQWLHGLLFDHLPQEYLGIYLDILQTLRLKIPQLIDKMIAVQPNINSKAGSITWETLGSLLKRSWDPIASSLNGNRLKKLPGNPILIIAPSGVGTNVSSRQHKWISQLGALGMVVTVHTHLGLAANRMTMMVCIDQLVQATRTKIQDIRSDCPGRPIILVGFNTGAALACQVAQMEHVTAVICLGFPFSTAEGKRGTPDDTLMDIRCPVMFVIGQNATLVRPDDLEDLREKMLVETSLVVVGTADDHLRISTAKKLSEGITQSMVDRCILDEIGDFVGSILLQPHPLPLRSTAVSSGYEGKNNRKEPRKRRNSTSSSVESEPNSPTVKKSRPNTPVSSALPVNQAGAPAKQGTQFGSQSLGGPNAGHSTTVKRKPRAIGNQKQHFVEHLITSRLPGQSAATENGGITLNIGSLASLAPVGPIRLAPASSSSQPVTNTTKTTPKSSTSSGKVPKIVSTNVPIQGTPKMKAIVSNSKGFSKVVSSNYRHLNTPDKNGDQKLVNVFATAGSQQIRVTTSTPTSMHNKPAIATTTGNFSNILQNGRTTPIALATGSSTVRSTSTPSILLTPNSSMANTLAPSTPTTSKAMDNDMAATTSSSSHAILGSAHSLETSKMSQITATTTTTRQLTTTSNNSTVNDHLQTTSCGGIVMVENPVRTTSSSLVVPLTGHNPGTILPLSNKLKAPQKTSIKSMPKITVNASNLQRIQKAKTIQRKSFANEIDDDLGNILDIPIIFAKDDDNLNSIEKNPSLVPVSTDSQDKGKLNPSTKVVLISNKQQDKQATNKLLAPTTQTIICPNVSMQNLNHVILQARSQNQTITAKTRATIPIQARLNHQPTIKYTKIILAKKNNAQISNRDEQVVLTKDKIGGAPKLLSFEKNEHRYACQLPSKLLTKTDDRIVDEVLEIEDAIKTNIIERKFMPVQEVDLTSPTKSEDAKRKFDEGTNSGMIDDLINLQT